MQKELTLDDAQTVEFDDLGVVYSFNDFNGWGFVERVFNERDENRFLHINEIARKSPTTQPKVGQWVAFTNGESYGTVPRAISAIVNLSESEWQRGLKLLPQERQNELKQLAEKYQNLSFRPSPPPPVQTLVTPEEQPDPNRREAVILFADIQGCANVSDARSLKDYAEFLKQFHASAHAAVSELTRSAKTGSPGPKYTLGEESSDGKGTFEFSIRGDELCVILYCDDKGDVLSALRLAYQLKIHWLLSSENKLRVKASQQPYEIAIGIHKGPVYLGLFGAQAPDLVLQAKAVKTVYSAEGYAINLAKRIETNARWGHHSQVFVSRSFMTAAQKLGIPCAFERVELDREAGKGVLRGFAHPILLYEVVSFVGTPKDPLANLSKDQQESALLPDTIGHMRIVLEENPHLVWLQCLYGACLAASYSAASDADKPRFAGEMRASVQALQAAAESDPGALLVRGIHHFLLDQWERAREMWRQALSRNLLNGTLESWVVRCSLEAKLWRDAANDLVQSQPALEQTDSSDVKETAKQLLSSKDSNTANQLLLKALQIPKHKEVLSQSDFSVYQSDLSGTTWAALPQAK